MRKDLARAALNEISRAQQILDNVDQVLRAPGQAKQRKELLAAMERLEAVHIGLLWRVNPALARHLENPEIPYEGCSGVRVGPNLVAVRLKPE
jgi:hypothetical protein